MKVKITISPMYNAIGVRLLLGEIGVIAPMLQDENTITTQMSEDQINRFRNSKGGAHRIDVIEPESASEPESESEPASKPSRKIRATTMEGQPA